MDEQQQQEVRPLDNAPQQQQEVRPLDNTPQHQQEVRPLDNIQQMKPGWKQLFTRRLRIGPLPTADEFEKYENVLPGAASRILTMAENQSNHRQRQEAEEQKAYARDSLLGLVFAFIFAMGALAGAVFLINGDHTITGTIVGGTGLFAVVGAFIQGRKHE